MSLWFCSHIKPGESISVVSFGFKVKVKPEKMVHFVYGETFCYCQSRIQIQFYYFPFQGSHIHKYIVIA